MCENNISEINDFITRRILIDNNWCNGNCYWFARILCDRFSYLDIYLLPIENHFMASDGYLFIDYNGFSYKDELNETPILFSSLLEEDPAYYNKLIRDCVN